MIKHLVITSRRKLCEPMNINIICIIYLGDTVSTRKNVTSISKIVRSLNCLSRLALSTVLSDWIILKIAYSAGPAGLLANN